MADFASEEARAAEFWEAIMTQPHDEDCDRCRAGLDAYIAAQLAGEDYLAQFPAVAAHLDRCVECAAAYAHLYELETAAEAGTLPAAAPAHQPDLSFLSGNSPARLLDRLLERTGDRLRLHLSPGLLPLLRPAPTLAPTRSTAGRLLYQLKGEEIGEPDLPLTLAVYEDPGRPELCLVEVTVALPGESWPDLGGRAVLLHLDDEVEQETTGAWGVAIFTEVPRDRLADMTLTVTGLL